MKLTHIETSRILLGDASSLANDRAEYSDLELLAESIREHGLLQPITVRPLADGEVFEIIAGHRRFMACAMVLGHTEIAAVVNDLDDDGAKRVMLAENTARAPLLPMEESNAYQRRIDAGETPREIALGAGVTESRVKTLAALRALCDFGQELLDAGLISVSLARKVVQLDKNRQLLALRPLARQEVTAEQFGALVTRLAAEQFAEAETPFSMTIEDHVDTVRRERPMGLTLMLHTIAHELKDMLCEVGETESAKQVVDLLERVSPEVGPLKTRKRLF